MSMRVFIYGSCVSRDAFDYQQGLFSLVKYVARTSLAAQLAAPIVLPDLLAKVPSKFQHEMMLIDMDKSLFKLLQQHEYDMLLVDLIDERFSIGLFNGARLTLSREFLDANAKVQTYPEWNRFSDEKFAAWQRGFSELVALVKAKVKPVKIIINKVYFADKVGPNTLSAVPCTAFLATEITRNNDYLSKMYQFIANTFPEIHCIQYTSDYFVANPQHKWGLAPFHYVDDLYNETIHQLVQGTLIGDGS